MLMKNIFPLEIIIISLLTMPSIDKCSESKNHCSDHCMMMKNSAITLPRSNCFCTSCDIFDDCCEDSAAVTGLNTTSSTSSSAVTNSLSKMKLSSDTRHQFECNVKLNGTLTYIYSVSRCDKEWKNSEIRSKCENVNEFLGDSHGGTIMGEELLQERIKLLTPMYSSSTKLTYRNVFCAFCNRVEPRSLSFFELEHSLKGFEDSEQTVIDEILASGEKLTFKPSVQLDMLRRCFKSVIDTCKANSSLVKIERCQNGPNAFRYRASINFLISSL